MIWYGILSLAANGAAIVLFFDRIQINAVSALPLVLMFFAWLQGKSFQNNPKGPIAPMSGYDHPEEEKELLRHAAYAMRLVIPLEIPFIFFFSSKEKLFSLAIYLFGLILGPAVFRAKQKKQ
jgi:hypothetical protein